MLKTSEQQEQIAVINWLRAQPGILWFHVPNERHCSAREGARLKALGVRSGVPDLIIPTPPPAMPGKHGTFLEMKRREGGRRSPEQIAWCQALLNAGWAGGFANGAKEAVDILRSLGYGNRIDVNTAGGLRVTT